MDLSSSSSCVGQGQQETAKKKLYFALMREKWDKVVNIFKAFPEIQDTKMADMVPRKNEGPNKHNDEYNSQCVITEKKVEQMYQDHPNLQATDGIVKPKNVNHDQNDDNYDSGDTALHWAITNKAPEDTVDKLVDEIANTGIDRASKTLKAKNNRGDSPLHCAASRGSLTICHRIISVYTSSVCERNNVGETPLFLAALNGHHLTFLHLHSICREVDPTLPSSFWKRNNGDTILHCSIRRKHYHLSDQIIELYKVQNIGSCFNIDGHLPLNELVMIPSAFKNGTRLSWWQKLQYYLIHVERPKSVEEQHLSNSSGYQTQSDDSPGKLRSIGYQDSSNAFGYQAQATGWIGSIRKLKENHVLGAVIMEELVKQDPWYRDNDNAKEMERIVNMKYYPLIDMEIQEGRIKISTALLIAAKNGLAEQVIKILTDIPVSVHDQLLIEKRNIVHVAVVERQSHVLEEVKKHKLWHVLREKVDADGNNALHLAAQLSKHTTWEIRGSVMQMQWEVKWFEYVKENMPPYFNSQTNKNDKTPGEIFTNEHKKLIEECNKSVKDTCGSYIVAATLVTGATFSACYQAPRELGHTFFISLLISFCFSITSLAAFLSIYSTRNERPKGFRRILPLKLCLGFFSFFASLVSMLVSFYAALSQDFEPEEKYQLIISYSVILLPASGLYAFTQIPLYWDLLIASFTKVPKPRIVEEDNISRFFHDSWMEQ